MIASDDANPHAHGRGVHVGQHRCGIEGLGLPEAASGFGASNEGSGSISAPTLVPCAVAKP